jgi:hypothetical protein
LSDECIHGFEAGLCAICYPKAVPEVAVAPAARTRVKSAAPRSTGPRTRAGRSVAGAAPRDDVSQQRLYHLTHIRNLPAILDAGELSASAHPEVDISPAGLRDERASVTFADDTNLNDYVPFFLSPHALVWQAIRTREHHPRLARDVVGTDPADFVLLVVTVKQLDAAGQRYAVTDGSAEGATTRFGWSGEDADRTLARLRAETLQQGILDADLLVHGAVPFSDVSLIGVAHDKARWAVRDLLGDEGYQPKVAVYPPWFAVEIPATAY